MPAKVKFLNFESDKKKNCEKFQAPTPLIHSPTRLTTTNYNSI